ncbi:DREV methyltransferase [Trypanosoma grayi]|uniref:DREV methyltransferase n=1 Tax=Trypanosoma grayi TaxID=71804 RepID=UPI0004F4297C|nr:DREV methyltransferase [Trypanosoma grayi]KEG12419.1 DREV methyltransferase [Trypanosoma grayi]
MAPTALENLSRFWSGQRKRPPISYAVNVQCLPQHITSKYMGMGMDEETQQWITRAVDVSAVKIILSNLLCTVFSLTTANGIVGRGHMFVMHTAQALSLLQGKDRPFPLPTGPLFDTLLDIGAGDGGVTAELQPLFRHVTATEYSIPMRWRLWWRGYEVLPYQDPFRYADGSLRQYDVISCLNVLDRADAPLTLLHSMRDSLAPNGILLLAVVLPWCPFVEDGKQQRRPAQKLPMEGGECCRGATFEASLERLVDNVLIPCGFKLERWTKLPYLCEGTLQTEYAVLYDAVLVLTRNVEGLTPGECGAD